MLYYACVALCLCYAYLVIYLYGTQCGTMPLGYYAPVGTVSMQCCAYVILALYGTVSIWHCAYSIICLCSTRSMQYYAYTILCPYGTVCITVPTCIYAMLYICNTVSTQYCTNIVLCLRGTWSFLEPHALVVLGVLSHPWLSLFVLKWTWVKIVQVLITILDTRLKPGQPKYHNFPKQWWA